MGKVSDAKKKVSGYLSAIRTMLNNYPQPQIPDEMDKLLGANTPFAFLMDLLRICGVSTNELMAWVSKILCGQNVIKSQVENIRSKEGDGKSWDTRKGDGYGVMDAFEEVAKALLLMNIQNMFTCSLNPFIPDKVMKDPTGKIEDFMNGEGIKIPLQAIDMYNILAQSPYVEKNKVNKKGKPVKSLGCMLYFDNDHKPNEMWKSTDLNAFLWYTINRGTNSNDGERKQIWDNRCRRWRKLSNNANFFNNFFNPDFGEKSFISMKGSNTEYGGYPNRPPREVKDGNGNTQSRPFNDNRKDQSKIKKLQYFIVNYTEGGGSRTNEHAGNGDYLTIWLNADRYIIQSDGNSDNKLKYNKTVFEFNYDFIQHIRLFDTKVIVGNVLNSLLGLTNSALSGVLGGNFSLAQQLIAGQIGKIVKDVINNDTVINDCSFNFSNEDYDKLLNETKEMVYREEDIENITTAVTDINNSATLEEAQTKITNALSIVSDFEKGKSDEGIVNISFGEDYNIIIKIIEECIIQIVMQMLGPKVMLVFAVNSYFMGDPLKFEDPAKFLIGLVNLITSMVKQLYDIIMKELIRFLMDEIRPLINLMIEKLLLERIRFYIELLKKLISLTEMFYNAFNTNKPKSVIDNVNYADIVPKQNEPETQTC